MKLKEAFTKALTQAIPILLTALVSVIITLLQSFLVAYTGSSIPTADPAQAGALGAGLKAIHTAFLYHRHIV